VPQHRLSTQAPRRTPDHRRAASAAIAGRLVSRIGRRIENWRWAGVPFFLRTGKALKASRQVVTIGFRDPVDAR